MLDALAFYLVAFPGMLAGYLLLVVGGPFGITVLISGAVLRRRALTAEMGLALTTEMEEPSDGVIALAARFATARQILLLAAEAALAVLLACGVVLAVTRPRLEGAVAYLPLAGVALLGLAVCVLASLWTFSRKIREGETRALRAHVPSAAIIRLHRIVTATLGWGACLVVLAMIVLGVLRVVPVDILGSLS